MYKKMLNTNSCPFLLTFTDKLKVFLPVYLSLKPGYSLKSYRCFLQLLRLVLANKLFYRCITPGVTFFLNEVICSLPGSSKIVNLVNNDILVIIEYTGFNDRFPRW